MAQSVAAQAPVAFAALPAPPPLAPATASSLSTAAGVVDTGALRARIASLVEQKRALEATVGQLRVKLEETRRESDELRGRYETARARVQTAEREMVDAAARSTATLTAETARLEEQVRAASARAEAANLRLIEAVRQEQARSRAVVERVGNFARTNATDALTRAGIASGPGAGSLTTQMSALVAELNDVKDSGLFWQQRAMSLEALVKTMRGMYVDLLRRLNAGGALVPKRVE